MLTLSASPECRLHAAHFYLFTGVFPVVSADPGGKGVQSLSKCKVWHSHSPQQYIQAKELLEGLPPDTVK